MLEVTTLHGPCGARSRCRPSGTSRRGTDRRRRVAAYGMPPALVTRSDRGAS